MGAMRAEDLKMLNIVEEFFIPVPWGQIAAKAWNNKGGEPMLALHGLLDNANSFERLIPLLPASYYYVCIDLPGHGHSSHLPPGLILDFFDFISAIERVVDHLQWDRFSLMGHSFGGQMSVMFTAMYPQRVNKLVMLDAIAPFCTELPISSRLRSYVCMLLKIKKVQSPQTYQYKEILAKFVKQRRDTISVEGVKLLLERGISKHLDGFTIVADQRLKLLLYLWLGDVDVLVDILRNVRCPQLITISKYIRRIMVAFKRPLQMFQQRDNFRYVYVDGNHDVHIDSPNLVAPVISQFLLYRTSAL